MREDLWLNPSNQGADAKRHGPCPILGIVGTAYEPLQNEEAFAFFDPVIQTDHATYETAGALGQGERVWVLTKMSGQLAIAGDDRADKYLLLSNSHDGSSSVQVKFTPIRVVCQNTLTMALRRGPTLSIHHRRDMRRRLRDAQETLGLIEKQFSGIEAAFQNMARVQMAGRRLEQYLERVLPMPRDPEDRAGGARVAAQRTRAADLFETGFGNRVLGVRGTLWAAYNGVTQMVDHPVNTARTTDWLESIWFGPGYGTKARAMTVAEDVMREWRN